MNKINVADFLKKYTMVIALVLVIIFFTITTNGGLLLPQNVANLIAQNAYVFVLATGMLLPILTGGNIDLSVGSVVCFVGAVGAVAMESWGMNGIVASLIVIALGTLIGAFQAYWIAYVRVPPFIVTLSGMLIFRGLSNIVLDGMTVSLNDETFIKIFGGGANCYIPDLPFFNISGVNVLALIVGALACILYVLLLLKGRVSKIKKGYAVKPLKGEIVKMVVICAVIIFVSIKLSQYKGVPSALVWVLIVVVVYSYITSKTTTGRYFYAVGGNEKATKLSGINTNKIYFIAYTNMGFLSALAALLTIARMSSSQPTYGQNYEMDAIGSCFIGGASAYGGVGTVPGVILGATLMGIINLGMNISGVDANWQKVVKGGVLLLAVIFDVVSKRQKN
ncbi:MAG: sugar ABC transporter permease [Lachnospiraceae bacterium]|nr:sugar ABC transporter permease [Lachnospiraceae bacterium]